MIRIQDLSLRVGSFALERISLEVSSGEYFVLLGPTGSGKSLLVKCLCGLLRVDGGSAWIDGEEITHLEPRRRRIGYVPQDYGLFPHLSVEQNVLFSLRARGCSRRASRREAEAVIEILGLGPLLGRFPAGLSGGERQKVALGRALAGRPRLLILDEPVSALDAPTRIGICGELRRVQRELGLPTIHVSHSQEEALAVSDRVGVLGGGRLVETGTMLGVIERPRSLAAARLLHGENVFEGTAAPSGEGGASGESASRISFAGGEVLAAGRFEGRVHVLVRAERIRVRGEAGEAAPDAAGAAGPSGASGASTIRARLARIEERRADRRLVFDAGNPLAVLVPRARSDGTERREELTPGRTYIIEIPLEAVWVIPLAG